MRHEIKGWAIQLLHNSLNKKRDTPFFLMMNGSPRVLPTRADAREYASNIDMPKRFVKVRQVTEVVECDTTKR